MSWNSAPSRRSCRTASTRCRTVALSDFMSGHRVVEPSVIEGVKRGVAGQGELLLVAAGPQVGAALQDVPPAVAKREGHDLAVRTGGGDTLSPLDGQQVESLGQDFRVVFPL